MEIDLNTMTTEQRNPETTSIDTMTALEIVTAMNREDAKVPQAIAPHLAEIAKAVEWASSSLQRGGRIIYMGAGTSGRLGMSDAAECPPTFGVSEDRVIALMAGGADAFLRAVENAEDDPERGRQDLFSHHCEKKDTVIGLAASGRTPYVVGGLTYAREVGAHTIAIACNQDSVIGRQAELAIEVVVGPEVLTGSTRLKAGTAQKLILNMISTAAMIRTGKAYQNLMVDVVQSNEKLYVRAENIVMEATGVDRTTAKQMIALAEGSAKVAIVMVLADCGRKEAEERLLHAQGHVRKAIQPYSTTSGFFF